MDKKTAGMGAAAIVFTALAGAFSFFSGRESKKNEINNAEAEDYLKTIEANDTTSDSDDEEGETE